MGCRWEPFLLVSFIDTYGSQLTTDTGHSDLNLLSSRRLAQACFHVDWAGLQETVSADLGFARQKATSGMFMVK